MADRNRLLAPEPGDGRYFFVGILAVVVVILGIVVIKHPTIGPARAINTLLGLQPTAGHQRPAATPP